MVGHGIPATTQPCRMGYNSVRYRVAHSVPNAVVLEALANITTFRSTRAFDELKCAAGAAITIPGTIRPTVPSPRRSAVKMTPYFDRGSEPEGYVALHVDTVRQSPMTEDADSLCRSPIAAGHGRAREGETAGDSLT